MEMTAPIGQTPLDRPDGLVGRPLDRVDGRLKVTGKARYAHEIREGAAPVHGFVVEATIAKGRVSAIDVASAQAAPGVLLVMTHANAPKQPARDERNVSELVDDRIRHQGQPVAFVVAETFEQARAAAALVKVTYAAETGSYDLRAAMGKAVVPSERSASPDTKVGSFESSFAAAPVTVDASYTTPPQSHAMMEPHATLAMWEGDKVTLYTANQMLNRGIPPLAATLGIPKENVRLVSHYVGGGFGGKLQVNADAALAALAARELKRPVKTALTRRQMFQVTTHRTDTIQRIRLGAEPDGRLTAIGHEVWCDNTPGESFYESAANATRVIYAAANRLTSHRLATLDLPVSSSMRAPGEAVGLLVLECAMDELAEKAGLDPIELRIRNEPTEDPEKRIPFSTRQLVPCMREGARLFGWDKRQGKPGSVREGRWLVGMGMAAAIRSNPLQPSKANVTLERDGSATVRMAMTDIGTGSYTIFTQIAADMLGLGPDRIRMELGDTRFPEAAGSGGSFGAASAGSALYDACDKLRAKLLQAADMRAEGAVFENGRVVSGNRSESLADLAGRQGMSADGEIKPGDMEKKFQQQSYGAHFAEVGVDMDSGEVRLRRMLGVFTAGRILNAKTARSQAIGGMIFGIGAALTEDLVIDARDGHFVNRDLAEYHLPVHADVPSIDAVFLPELDDKTNPLKSKGLGELGICGAGAAIANAVYNASGVRVRDYPLTLDKVMGGLA